VDCNDIALHLEDVCKSFGKIRAVDHLSLDVSPGEMVGFLGPNGAGKSTTLYMTSRLVRPSAGVIKIFGHDVWKDFKEAIRCVGIMVETPSFYEYLPARKNLELMARLLSDSNSSQIDEILERIGLFERRNDKVATYSHGMKQRLGLGMALIGKPKLLILDEPTNGMDPEGTREILSFLREKIKNERLTVFVSSHLLYEVQEYCDRVFVINHGCLIASGKVKELLTPLENVLHVTFQESTVNIESLLHEDGIELVERLSSNSFVITLKNRDAVWLNRLLLNRGFSVSAISPKQKTLKEFFLSVTGENNG
jgi:ABC-type multidrug transport system ATPase subunit